MARSNHSATVIRRVSEGEVREIRGTGRARFGIMLVRRASCDFIRTGDILLDAVEKRGASGSARRVPDALH